MPRTVRAGLSGARPPGAARARRRAGDSVCSQTRRHCGDLRPGRVGYGAGGDPLPGLPPGRPVLVEQRGDGVLDPRREVAHRLVRRRRTSGSPKRIVSCRRPREGQPWPRGIAANVPAVRDRHDRDAVLLGEEGRAHPELAHPAVGRAGALGEDHQAPAVGQHLARRRGHGAAAAVDREGVEEERRPDRAPPGVEEVVGRGRHRRTPAPLVGQRQQDQRGVEVRGVVGHEDDRALDALEDVETLDPGAAHCERKSGCRPAFCATSRAAIAGLRARPVAREDRRLRGRHELLRRARHLGAPAPAPARARPA